MVIQSAAIQPTSADGREDARSNIFVIATLYSPTGQSPVRVRNLSRTGALVEGAVLPVAGTAVRLSRGSMAVAGHVVWCEANKAGLRFDAMVCVADWLPQGGRATGQQRVDEIVYEVNRNGGAKGGVSAPVPVAMPTVDVAGELRQLGACLSGIAEELAGDPEVAARFGTRLQVIELGAQSLVRLAASLRSTQPG